MPEKLSRRRDVYQSEAPRWSPVRALDLHVPIARFPEERLALNGQRHEATRLGFGKRDLSFTANRLDVVHIVYFVAGAQ